MPPVRATQSNQRASPHWLRQNLLLQTVGTLPMTQLSANFRDTSQSGPHSDQATDGKSGPSSNGTSSLAPQVLIVVNLRYTSKRPPPSIPTSPP